MGHPEATALKARRPEENEDVHGGLEDALQHADARDDRVHGRQGRLGHCAEIALAIAHVLGPLADFVAAVGQQRQRHREGRGVASDPHGALRHRACGHRDQGVALGLEGKDLGQVSAGEAPPVLGHHPGLEGREEQGRGHAGDCARQEEHPQAAQGVHGAVQRVERAEAEAHPPPAQRVGHHPRDEAEEGRGHVAGGKEERDLVCREAPGLVQAVDVGTLQPV
mmetsp:Transcript_12247/g.38378  ORF Transcript_12247/g.38378 Transcript_12247/m.38378 type:complete len:223 (+) Transcript_12247:709-1377(+)